AGRSSAGFLPRTQFMIRITWRRSPHEWSAQSGWRCGIIGDTACRKIEKGDDGTAPDLRIGLASGLGSRPHRTLPGLQSHQLGALIQGHDQVDFSVWMAVILAPQNLAVILILDPMGMFAVYVHGRNAELKRRGRRLLR